MKRTLIALALACMTAGFAFGITPISQCDCGFWTKVIMCQHFLL